MLAEPAPVRGTRLMTGAGILVLFVAGLMVAARLFLHPEKRPPIPTDNDCEHRSTQPKENGSPSATTDHIDLPRISAVFGGDVSVRSRRTSK